MRSIRDRLLERDRERFVGRGHELDRLVRMLDGHDEQRIGFVVGHGGVGKSALLRATLRLASERGIASVWIDGRDVTPFQDDISDTLAATGDSERSLVVFDSYELVNSLDSHLRNVVLPNLPDTTLVLFGSRQPPSPGWFEDGWDTVVGVIELDVLDDRAAAELVRNRGIDDEARIDAIVRRSGGSPLALNVYAEADGDVEVPYQELADRLLRDEVSTHRLRALTVASIARVTTPELLAEALDEPDAEQDYKWLASRSFAEPLAAGITVHALVADSVRSAARATDPIGEGILRRRIADHLHRRALAGHAGMSPDLQHLIEDPTVRWGYSADIGSRFRIDVLRPGDADEIGSILVAVGQSDWWKVTRVLFDHHPELVCVARDADGGVGGYAIAVTPRTAPELAHRDVLLGPWLRYTRDVLATDSAVLWREAVDLTGELGEVTSLLGAGGLISSGIANPRYLFLPIAPEVPAAGEFSARLDGVHVPELDLFAHGMSLECHIVDMGPGGLIGRQRDWIYRETGSQPPTTAGDVDAAELLKWLRSPATLADGPHWLGSSPYERWITLRSIGEDALDVFGPSADDVLARSIIVAAYLSDNRSHEAVARDLHLSRSAYFRRLHAASARFGAEAAARARRLR